MGRWIGVGQRPSWFLRDFDGEVARWGHAQVKGEYFVNGEKLDSWKGFYRRLVFFFYVMFNVDSLFIISFCFLCQNDLNLNKDLLICRCIFVQLHFFILIFVFFLVSYIFKIIFISALNSKWKINRVEFPFRKEPLMWTNNGICVVGFADVTRACKYLPAVTTRRDILLYFLWISVRRYTQIQIRSLGIGSLYPCIISACFICIVYIQLFIWTAFIYMYAF